MSWMSEDFPMNLFPSLLGWLVFEVPAPCLRVPVYKRLRVDVTFLSYTLVTTIMSVLTRPALSLLQRKGYELYRCDEFEPRREKRTVRGLLSFA